MQKKLSRDGIRTIGQLQKMDERDLVARYDSIGLRLARLSRGQDSRKIVPQSVAKSISSETTFNEDLGTLGALEKHLWALSERTAERCKRKNMAGTTVVLKLKTTSFTTLTRNRAISDPTQLADTIFAVGKALLTRLLDDKPGTKFRLIGIGLSGLVDGAHADPPDLADPDKTRRKAAEQAMDDLRANSGAVPLKKGGACREFSPKQRRKSTGSRRCRRYIKLRKQLKMTIENKLEDLGLVLPDPKPPLGAYVPYLEQEGLVFISGQGPVLAGGGAICGRLGDGLDIEDGARRAAFGTEYSRANSRGCRRRLAKISADCALVRLCQCHARFHTSSGGCEWRI